MRIKRAAALTAVAGSLLLAGMAAGCGDDDEDSGTASSTTSTETADTSEVTVIATEYAFELSATPTTETTSVTFDNQGEEGHFLVFAKINEGFTIDEAVELEGKEGSAETILEKGVGPGQSKTFELDGPVEPGEWTMLCPIPSPDGPHYKLGQLAEFTVE